jgi:hypothetical protein
MASKFRQERASLFLSRSTRALKYNRNILKLSQNIVIPLYLPRRYIDV